MPPFCTYIHKSLGHFIQNHGLKFIYRVMAHKHILLILLIYLLNSKFIHLSPFPPNVYRQFKLLLFLPPWRERKQKQKLLLLVNNHLIHPNAKFRHLGIIPDSSLIPWEQIPPKCKIYLENTSKIRSLLIISSQATTTHHVCILHLALLQPVSTQQAEWSL